TSPCLRPPDRRRQGTEARGAEARSTAVPARLRRRRRLARHRSDASRQRDLVVARTSHVTVRRIGAYKRYGLLHSCSAGHRPTPANTILVSRSSIFWHTPPTR